MTDESKITTRRFVAGAPPAEPGEDFSSPGSVPINIVMSKPRGRFSLHIFTDPEDSHFCRAELRNKDGEVKAHHYFIMPDLAQWLSMYEADGYQPVNNRKSTGHEHKI